MSKLLAFALLSVAAATCDLTCSHATGIIVTSHVATTTALEHRCYVNHDTDTCTCECPDETVSPTDAPTNSPTVPAHGCASGSTALSVPDHDDIYLCPWGGGGFIHDQHGMCSSGYHVCTGSDVHTAGVTWNQATGVSGCYAYDSASDCDACYSTCLSSTSVNGNNGCYDTAHPDMAGLGSGCHSSTSSRTECLSGGGLIRAHDGSNLCYTDKDVGVACCAN
jgi:hypothetical protein